MPLAATAALAAEGTWVSHNAATSGATRHAPTIVASAASADSTTSGQPAPAVSQLKWGPPRAARAAASTANPTAASAVKPGSNKPVAKITLTGAQAEDEDDLFKPPSRTKPAAPNGNKPKDPFADEEDLKPPSTDPDAEMPEPKDESEPALEDEPLPPPKAETLPELDAEPEPPRLRNPMQTTPPKRSRPATPRPPAGSFARPRSATPMEDLEQCDTAKKRMLANRLSTIVLDIRVRGEQGTDIPPECDLDAGHFVPRSWCETTLLWKASALCHKPLYFEDVQLERYGHEWGPVLQPVVSGAHFFVTLPILPYKMGLQTPNECVYALGYYRPGSCAPYMIEPIPFTWRAAIFEAGAWVGGAAAIP